MQTDGKKSFDEVMAIFSRHFYLGTRLPSQVFCHRKSHKFVVRESGDLHKMDVFERLSDTYQDKAIFHLLIAPTAEELGLSVQNQIVSTLRTGKDFSRRWRLNFSPNSTSKSEGIGWPREIALLQSYVGSSQLWSSYHDSNEFELDIFYVPIDCDVESVFGKPTWSLADFIQTAELHGIVVNEAEMSALTANYFKFIS